MTEEDKCSICYESYKKDKIKIILECKHTFHFNCLKKWKEEDKDTCPLCRGKMNLNLTENKKEEKEETAETNWLPEPMRSRPARRPRLRPRSRINRRRTGPMPRGGLQSLLGGLFVGFQRF